MNELVKVTGNEVLVSSIDISANFGKRHDGILRDIYNIMKSDSTILWNEMFIETTYVNRGKNYKCYNMNRDGFSLLAMGFTGKKALEWKMKYINAFNIMEEKIKKSNSISEEERLKLMLFSKKPEEVAYASNRLVELATAPLIATIEEQKPLADFAKRVTDSTSIISMGEMAKLLRDENINIGQNRLFKWLRNRGILMNNNVPYQKYIDGGYFKVIESTFNTPYGNKVQLTTRVTGKGQIYITEKLRKEFGEIA